jgi:hypothetical protein
LEYRRNRQSRLSVKQDWSYDRGGSTPPTPATLRLWGNSKPAGLRNQSAIGYCWCKSSQAHQTVRGMDEDKILAYLYKQFRDFMMGMPSSIGDLLDAPPWFRANENSDESPIYQMIEIADKRTREILNQ